MGLRLVPESPHGAFPASFRATAGGGRAASAPRCHLVGSVNPAAARSAQSLAISSTSSSSARSPGRCPRACGLGGRRGSHESGRPGSNRRRPAWEAFWALAGQGFFGGGSRNGITQYGLAAPDIRDFPPFRERPFETSAAPRPSSCWSPRNGGARRASRPRRDPPNLTRGAGSGVVGPPRHNRYAATHHPEANVRVPVGNVAEKNNAPASKSGLDQLTSLHGPSTP